MAAVAIALLSGAYLKGRWDGSSACEVRWERKAEIERTRQRTENDKAKEAERARIAALNARIKQLEDLNDILDKEAAADPDAERPALGVDSVRRIGRVR